MTKGVPQRVVITIKNQSSASQRVAMQIRRDKRWVVGGVLKSEERILGNSEMVKEITVIPMACGKLVFELMEIVLVDLKCDLVKDSPQIVAFVRDSSCYWGLCWDKRCFNCRSFKQLSFTKPTTDNYHSQKHDITTNNPLEQLIKVMIQRFQRLHAAHQLRLVGATRGKQDGHRLLDGHYVIPRDGQINARRRDRPLRVLNGDRREHTTGDDEDSILRIVREAPRRLKLLLADYT